MQTALSPSRLVTRAVGLAPTTDIKCEDATHCGFCGVAISVGQDASKLKLTSQFNNIGAMAKPTATLLCGDCESLWKPEFLMNYAYSVVTEKGLFPFRKNIEQSYFLLNPPKPPFLMFCATTKQQHLIWRTPVNYSRDVFYVRFGNNVLRIRHANLLSLIGACDEVAAFVNSANENESGKAPKYALRHPFAALDRQIDDVYHGRLHTNVIERFDALQKALPTELNAIMDATPGELWALTIILQTRAKHPLAELIEPPFTLSASGAL